MNLVNESLRDANGCFQTYEVDWKMWTWENNQIIRWREIRKKLGSGCDCRWGYQERLKHLWDTVGHIWACFYAHRHTKQFLAGHLPLPLRSSPPSSCPVRAVLTGCSVAGSGKRLKTAEFRHSFSWLLSACTYSVTVVGTAAAVLWDRSCLFPQGGFIIISFIYSLLYCLFASIK